MKISFLYFNILSLFIGSPTTANTDSIKVATGLSAYTSNVFGLPKQSQKDIFKINFNFKKKNTLSNLAIQISENKQTTLDGSSFRYIFKSSTLGFGKISRNWSFSPKTSLIMSSNSKPPRSIFFFSKNRHKLRFLPHPLEWSFDIFNSTTKQSLNNQSSMMVGTRITISPIKNLNFELLRTGQWGGQRYESGLDGLFGALFSDTNTSKNSNVNQLAGFGFSYKMPKKYYLTKIYGQVVGEDEAGNLPSCFMHMYGLEWSLNRSRYPTSLGIEIVDTRIGYTENGFCGPNTAYNNGVYDYSHYGVVMGAAIDTESKSTELFGATKISKKIEAKYSIKKVLINEHNSPSHRLTSTKETGLISSVSVSYINKNLTITSGLFHQSFNLKKANIQNGVKFGFSTSISF